MMSTVEKSLVHKIRPHWRCIPKEEKKYHRQHIIQQEISLQQDIVYTLFSSKFPGGTVVEYQTVVPKVIGSRFGFYSCPSPYKFDICESLLEKFNFYCKIIDKTAGKLFQDPDICPVSSVQDVELSINFFTVYINYDICILFFNLVILWLGPERGRCVGGVGGGEVQLIFNICGR